MSSHSETGWGGSGRRASEKVDGEPDPEPLAAPPIIILSENSNLSGSQPQEQDPDIPSRYTSFSQFPSLTPNNRSPRSCTSTLSQRKPKPQPEPHPAPPVIILSHKKRPASSSPPAPSSPLSPPLPTPEGPFRKSRRTTIVDNTQKNRAMGSKASKLTPKGGKLQPSQERKDKEEMKEPTNYYTHRSKSMRRKAGKEGTSDGVGGSGGGAGGGAGGAA